MVEFENQLAQITLTPVKVPDQKDTFQEKQLVLRQGSSIKIGRKVSPKLPAEYSNGIFDAKVLSRTHAEISFDRNTVLIQDLKSSNGTFVNGILL